MFAWCRSKPIKSVQYLTAQTLHARREDTTSPARVRPDATPGAALSWSVDDGPRPDYGAAFKAMKKVKGAGERKGAQIGLHMLVGVSLDWVREAGDLHDPDNPRNRELLDAARAWADSWSGGGCYAARLDLDETGGAVVDLFIAPLAEQKHKSGKVKLVVSVNKALESLSMEHTGRKGRHYAALNTSWAEHAQASLDPRLARGRPREETGAEHVGPDQYRTMMQEAQAARDAAKAREKAAAEKERRLDATLGAMEALAQEVEDGTLRFGPDGRMKAKNPARLGAGGRIVSLVASAILHVLKDVKALRDELRTALDEGRIKPEQVQVVEKVVEKAEKPSMHFIQRMRKLQSSASEEDVQSPPETPSVSRDGDDLGM